MSVQVTYFKFALVIFYHYKICPSKTHKIYDHFHNISRLIGVLSHCLFITSETMHDYYL